MIIKIQISQLKKCCITKWRLQNGGLFCLDLNLLIIRTNIRLLYQWVRINKTLRCLESIAPVWDFRNLPGQVIPSQFHPLLYFPHDDVIKWKYFPRYWPFVRGIHRSPVNSPHKGQWRGALMFSLVYVWINGWVNNRGAGDLRRYRAHYDVIVMIFFAEL